MAKLIFVLIISVASILIFIPRFYLLIGQSDDNRSLSTLLVYQQQQDDEQTNHVQQQFQHYRLRNQHEQQQQRHNNNNDDDTDDHLLQQQQRRLNPILTSAQQPDDNDGSTERYFKNIKSSRQIVTSHPLAAAATTTTTTKEEYNCRLPKLDPWDESIAPFIDKDEDRLRHCKTKVIELTELIDGELRLIESASSSNTKCAFRCLYPKNDISFTFGQWMSIDTDQQQRIRPMCDIVEVDCRQNDVSIYTALHTQIFENDQQQGMIDRDDSVNTRDDVAATTIDDKDDKNRHQQQPSVIIILLDSVSSSEGIRSLSETIQVLNDDYNAIIFRYLNKVGQNSRPNGFALFNGVQIQSIPAGVYYDRPIKSELPDYCQRFLNNGTFIVDYFTEIGYKSLMSEDWAEGVFNWPNCKGFDEKPTTHYMRPFQLRIDKDERLKHLLTIDRCKEAHHYVMDYLKQFVSAYENEPKIAITWLSYLAHDSANGLYHADAYFADFFRSYRQQLKDNFVFLMGDHGLRFGNIRTTPVGNIEDNNPMLIMSVPEHLRTHKQLQHNLIQNSNRLITHFDLYATLIDIAKFAPKHMWNDYSVIDWRTVEETKNHGESLLRPINSIRNCKTLHLPISYCMCQYETVAIDRPQDDQISINAAQFITDYLNDYLKKRHFEHICAPMSLAQVIKSEKINVVDSWPQPAVVFRILFSVKPSNGSFEGYVSLNAGSYQMVAPDVTRTNSYGQQSYCTKVSNIRPYCYCRTHNDDDDTIDLIS